MLNWSIYLCHKTFLSIQHHTLRHTDQSRDYREFGHCNVLRTVDYSWYRTILFLHSVHTEDWLLSKAVKHFCNDTELKLHLKFGLCWFTIHNLTCSQYIPVHPGLHVKHVPFCMRYVPLLLFVGQRVSQFLP